MYESSVQSFKNEGKLWKNSFANGAGLVRPIYCRILKTSVAQRLVLWALDEEEVVEVFELVLGVICCASE